MKFNLILTLITLSNIYLFSQTNEVINNNIVDTTEDIEILCSEMPLFKNSNTLKLVQFINDSMQYPIIAKESGLEGTVYVNFVVEKNGSISNVTIIRGISFELNNEAIRLINLTNNLWTCAKRDGIKIRFSQTIPIKFNLVRKIITDEEIENVSIKQKSENLYFEALENFYNKEYQVAHELITKSLVIDKYNSRSNYLMSKIKIEVNQLENICDYLKLSEKDNIIEKLIKKYCNK